MVVNTRSSSNVGLIVQGSSSQTADILEIRNSSNAILAKFDSGGNLSLTPATNSSYTFRVQNASGTDFVTADSTNSRLTVTNLVASSSLTVNGHIITGNTSGSTTATVGAGAGTSATCTLSRANDTSGLITVSTGASGVAAGTLCTVNFISTYGAIPKVVLTPQGNASAAIQYNVGSVSTAAFTLSTGTAPTASTTYTYFYHAEQ